MVLPLVYVIQKLLLPSLKKNLKYKLKGTVNISYHLGCDFFRDDEDSLCMAPKKYIKKMIDGCMNIFNKKPSSKYK